MKKMCLSVLFFVALMSGSLGAQTVDKKMMDSLMTTIVENNKGMGSIAISKNGTILYRRSIGFADFSGTVKVPAGAETKYRIGSIGKVYTAAMIFQLIEEKKITLNTSVAKYFPSVPNADSVTIGHLLNHRSGLHEFTDDSTYPQWMSLPKSRSEILALIVKHPVDFRAGERSAYSNTNYALLGMILETVTGMSYAENLKRRITDKIGLKHTFAGGRIETKKNEANSFRWNGTWERETETDMSITGGAGCIIATPTDLTKFIEALFAGRVVSPASLEQMRTITDRYGMGLRPAPFYEKKGFGHNGRIDGFRSNLAYFPDDSVAIAYCSNGEVYSTNEIIIGMLSIVFGKEYSIPTFTAITLTANELEQYLGEYSSTQMPLKITILKKDVQLYAQATGQGAFPLTAVEKDRFRFDEGGVKVDFDPAKGQFTITQRGTSFLFTKKIQ